MTEQTDVLVRALGGRYAIEEVVGRGGMATVYRARSVGEDRVVAIKVFRPTDAVRMGRERFLREIAVSAKLVHPHIVRTLDYGEAADLLFYVMPLLDGSSLRRRIQREQQLGVEEATGIARAVAGALDAAHRRGVLHRDVKPENVLFERERPLLADFGAAVLVTAALEERLTRPGEVLGTPLYMSPEQAMGRRSLSPASDVYSLACVVYEMLCGTPPFVPANPRALLVRQIREPPPAARDRRPDVPAVVERAIRTALAWRPADRFQRAGDFAAAL